MGKEKVEKEIEVKDIIEAQEKINQMRKDSSINKPSEKEINDATSLFNDAAAKFNSKKFKIGKPEDGDIYLNFMIEFIDKYVFWTKQGWMGVIKMNEELKEIKESKKENESFSMGYQPLAFTFNVLTNPGGTGLQSAKDIDSLIDTYGKILEDTEKAFKEAQEELKEIQFLQDTVTAMQQGFYLEKEDSVEIPEEFNAPNVDDLIKNKSQE